MHIGNSWHNAPLQRETLETEEALRSFEKCHLEVQTEILKTREAVAADVEHLRCFNYCNYMVRTHAERDRAGLLLTCLANPAKQGSLIVELATDEGGRLYW
ncbi:hypothetical protein NDU88_003034 [Pleurodeles waltl]|uniref:Uncharacterized protein n=1 Tax=Pleurodeles waltl TaxID=8319 RepID=A0AAV7KTR2_PLEWA|nr:hypothetical protein NDU88_003034 [Pleurodeles waltl]